MLDQIVFFLVGESNDVCISQGGRFPPFSMEGKPPKKVSKAQDLTLCRVFRKKTCCGVAQTHPALLSVRRLASTGEGNQECLQLWELLECSICDPQVGVQPGPPQICTSFCDRVFKACSDAYFSVDAKTQVSRWVGVLRFFYFFWLVMRHKQAGVWNNPKKVNHMRFLKTDCLSGTKIMTLILGGKRKWLLITSYTFV